MNKLWRWAGVVSFWLSWPALWVYLRRGKRTRLLLICGEECLVLNSWLGSGVWGFPGGGVHDKEESEDGLIREVEEETGIKLTKSQIRHAYQAKSNYRSLKFIYDCYICEMTEKPAVHIQRGEITDYAWIPIKSPDRPLAKDAEEALSWWRMHGKL